ncbi:SRPBCC family protein [Pseudoalteromonas phenolica]|uniref:SRPBCC family protein n=1 Tax=Pseudoalteromonas phenolica TaxID=161398 RepID=UPI00384C253B
MKVQESIVIPATKEQIWRIISDIRHAHQHISAIKSLVIIEQPKEGLKGLKWQETRTMFGKDASEIMWITESETNVFYKTKAQSHGCDYYSEMRITEHKEQCELIMSFKGEPHTLFAKFMSAIMSRFMVQQLRKTIQADLEDIKNAVMTVHNINH